jgi:hypothetical protein
MPRLGSLLGGAATNKYDAITRGLALGTRQYQQGQEQESREAFRQERLALEKGRYEMAQNQAKLQKERFEQNMKTLQSQKNAADFKMFVTEMDAIPLSDQKTEAVNEFIKGKATLNPDDPMIPHYQAYANATGEQQKQMKKANADLAKLLEDPKVSPAAAFMQIGLENISNPYISKTYMDAGKAMTGKQLTPRQKAFEKLTDAEQKSVLMKPDTVINTQNAVAKQEALAVAKEKRHIKSPKFRSEVQKDVKALSDRLKWSSYSDEQRSEVVRVEADKRVRLVHPDAQYGEVDGKTGWYMKNKDGVYELIVPWSE